MRAAICEVSLLYNCSRRWFRASSEIPPAETMRCVSITRSTTFGVARGEFACPEFREPVEFAGLGDEEELFSCVGFSGTVAESFAALVFPAGAGGLGDADADTDKSSRKLSIILRTLSDIAADMVLVNEETAASEAAARDFSSGGVLFASRSARAANGWVFCVASASFSRRTF